MIDKVLKKIDPKSKLSSFLLPGAHEGGTLGYLVFDELNTNAIIFIKIFRDKNDKRLKNEVNFLKNNKNNIVINIPDYIYHEKGEICSFICQTVLPGKPLSIEKYANSYSKIDFDNKVKMVVSWLRKMPKSTCDNSAIAEEFIIKNSAIMRKIFTKSDIKSIVLTINNISVIEHGDFVLHNILKDGENINVIDWSDVSSCGTPLFDLYNFLINALFKLRKSSKEEDFIKAFEFGFFENNEISSIIKDNVGNYLNFYNMDEKSAKFILFMYLYKYSKNENDKLVHSFNDGYMSSYISKLGGCKKTGIFERLFNHALTNHELIIL